MTDNTVVRQSVVVDAPVERAFATFTQRMVDFKPREHTLLHSPVADTVFEPRVGGHILDRGEDGSECRWARILAFEPPDRVVFSWDIGPTWQIVTDPEMTSEVEVRFLAEGPERTRVELEHRNIDRHGPGLDRGAGWGRGSPRLAAVPGPVRGASRGGQRLSVAPGAPGTDFQRPAHESGPRRRP